MNLNEWLEIRGKHCLIWVTPRPPYCDRGNFLAHIDVTDPTGLELDGADGWPRYYFDEERMKLEIIAWLQKRKEFVNDTFTARRVNELGNTKAAQEQMDALCQEHDSHGE